MYWYCGNLKSRLALALTIFILQLKDENGKLVGVDTSNLFIANSGNDLPVSRKSPLLYVTSLYNFEIHVHLDF